jgi:hypothetical protein
MLSIEQFVKNNKIRIQSCERTRQNPNNTDWKDADHWKCVLVCGKRNTQLTVHYSMGYGHNGRKPNVCEMLSSLASDANSSDMSFSEFCREFGYEEYDEDDYGRYVKNKKVEKIYKACVKSEKDLKRLLGNEQFDILLYNTESY